MKEVLGPQSCLHSRELPRWILSHRDRALRHHHGEVRVTRGCSHSTEVQDTRSNPSSPLTSSATACEALRGPFR